jgi:hypothetical protein
VELSGDRCFPLERGEGCAKGELCLPCLIRESHQGCLCHCVRHMCAHKGSREWARLLEDGSCKPESREPLNTVNGGGQLCSLR